MNDTIEILDEPVDGDAVSYEWLDTGTLIVTVVTNSGETVHETYKFEKGEK